MEIKLYTTFGEGAEDESICQKLQFCEDREGIEDQVVNIYPARTFEIMEGFGGAITDAAAYVYSLMSESQKKELIQTYFSENQMKYGIIRIHMDSCDFSTDMYEAMSNPEDKALTSFNFQRTEKYMIPMLQDAQNVVGKPLELMLSPWSPPAFMKTNGKRNCGGSLKEEYGEMWADYICRYMKEFTDRGFCVKRISLQNEPKAVQTWDSCVYTSKQEKDFLENYMYPALKKHQLEHVEIFIWDHNKERIYERVKDIMDDTTKKMVAGVAFHWYSGDHFEALDLVRTEFPELKMIQSESCIEYSKYQASSQKKHAARLSHEIIGDLNHGMTAFYDWNLLLNEEGGPNHVGNLCHAPFLYEREKEKLMPQLLLKHIGHFSRYIEKGARRIGYSKYTDQIDVTAYCNLNGQMVIVLLNRTAEIMKINLRLNGEVAEMILYPESISTGIIR